MFNEANVPLVVTFLADDSMETRGAYAAIQSNTIILYWHNQDLKVTN